MTCRPLWPEVEVSIRERAVGRLRSALERLPMAEDTAAARRVLQAQIASLGAPLRVAVVGRTNAGKSTLVNGLIGCDLLPVGNVPLTCAVTWLRYDATRSVVVVHPPDGSPSQEAPLTALGALTARDEHGRAGTAAKAGALLEIRERFPCLRRFDLIDTPGLDSPHDADVRVSTALLEPRVAAPGAAADSRGLPHAMVCVLNVAASRTDVEALDLFGRNEQYPLSPITALAVLTKVELLWDPDPGQPNADPLRTAARHARLILRDPTTARSFAEVLPVCSQVASAAAGLGEQDLDDLTDLCRLSPARLDDVLSDWSGFATRGDVPVPASRRAGLAGRLTPYGVSLAAALLREGVPDLPGLSRALRERSGMTSLWASLDQRFGNRAELIKLSRAVEMVCAIPAALPAGTDPRRRVEVAGAVALVADLRRDELAFEEYEVLRALDSGALRLPDEVVHELRTTLGSAGASVAARLGLPPSAPLSALEQVAEAGVRDWSRPHRALAIRDGAAASARTVESILRRRYEDLLLRVRRARAVLEQEP